jgi:SNF2 family DNA or RNA helicase
MITIDTLTNKTLALQFHYDPELIEIVKNIPGRKWDAEKKIWTIPFYSLKPATEILDGKFELTDKVISLIEEESNSKIKELEKIKNLISSVNLDDPLPDNRILFEHQKGAIKELLIKQRAILAYDMGLGKTLIALVAAKILKNQNKDLRVITIAPVSLRDNWLREAESIDLEIEIFSWAKQPKEIDSQYVLIADEAHYIQSGKKSLRGKIFLELSQNENCVACYCLTGTPMKNGRPINLFPLLKATQHELSKNQSYFHIHYCDAHETRFTRWDISGAINLDELFLKTRDVLLRKTKKECLDLPEKLRVLREVEPSSNMKELYNKKMDELKHQYQERLASGEVLGNNEALVILGFIRHASSLAKTETAIELAEEIIESGGQVVIFTEFRESAKIIFEYFNENAVLLTGETEDRQLCVDLFQTGRAKVFVGTIKAGGLGITLTASSTVILVDRPYTPGDTEQAEDRLHRIGQINPVTAIWLQYNEVDKDIDELLQSKQENINLTLHGIKKRMRFNSIHELAKYNIRKIFKDVEWMD